MNIFVTIILDTVVQQRLVAAFTAYDGARHAIGAWGTKRAVEFLDPDATQRDEKGNIANHFTSTDGMVKAVILETELLEVV